MASKWKHTITFYKEWGKKYRNNECGLSDIAIALAKDFRQTLPSYFNDEFKKYNEELVELIEHFEDMPNDEFLTVDEFDNVLTNLYDWADENGVWIEPSWGIKYNESDVL